MKARPAAERRFLARYRPGAFSRPSVTVDVALFSVVDAELRVLLIRRAEHPFKGLWALPGGFVRVGSTAKDRGESLDDAAFRELVEETGLSREHVYLEQLAAFGAPDRDPRMRVISVAYYALVRPDLLPLVRAGGDASAADWLDVASLHKKALAFDHAQIIERARARLAEGVERTDVARSLVPKTFTIPELRQVVHVVTGVPQDPGNFRRRFQHLLELGVIEQAPGKRVTATKPALVYRFAGSPPPRR